MKLSPVALKYLKALEDEAMERNMKVDYETLTIVPLDGYSTVWPVYDRTPEDYEGGA